MAHRERDILERSVQAIAEQAVNTNKVIDEAMEVGLAADHPVKVATKQVRLELLKVKADLERELAKLVLNCTACGQEVQWVQGISMADPLALRGVFDPSMPGSESVIEHSDARAFGNVP